MPKPMTDKITVYHNPRCSKSRATVEWLTQQGLEFETIEYLKMPLDKAALKQLQDKLDLPAGNMIRQGEKIYKETGLHHGQHSDDQLLAAITEHPILLERPIVSVGDEAAIGRPLQNVIALFDDL
jgi:arsenate reductase